MAIEKTIEINVDSKQAEKNLKEINVTINEQREILVLLEEEYAKAKQALDKYNSSGRVNLAQEKQLKSQLTERKDALTDQRLGLKKLAVEQRAATQVVNEFKDAQKDNTNIIRGIDKLTGGYATKIVKLKKGFISGLKGVKAFATGLKGLRGALIATGIGALVVALGSIIAYWDEIKSLVSGVTKEQKEGLRIAEENVALAQQQLDITKASENTLRLQGKTEKEIRDIKIQQTNESILALEAQLLAQKEIKKSQIETSKRNKNILQGIIRFVSAPLTLILKMIDGITYAASLLPGVGDIATNLEGKFSGGLAGLIFDPSEVASEADKTIKETEKQLRNLKNTRDGYILSEQKENKKNRNKELADQKKQNEEKLKLEKEYQEKLKSLKERIRDAEANTVEEERALQLKKLKEEHKQLLVDAFLNGLLTRELTQSLKEREDELQATFDEQDKAAADKKKKEEEDAREKEAADIKTQEEFKENQYRKGYDDLQNIVSLGGKKLEKVGKALAIADVVRTASKSVSETISSTAAANAKAVSASPLTAGMPFVAINTVKAALSIGSTVAGATKSISSIKGNAKSVSGSAPASGGSGGGGGSAPAPPSFNIVGASGSSQLADAIGGQSQQPIQTYVVANDVTTAQSLQNNIVEGATIG